MNLPLSTHEFVKLQHENRDNYDNTVKMYQDIIDHVKFLEQDLNPNMFLGKNPLFEGWRKAYEDAECFMIECEGVTDLFYLKETKHFEWYNSRKRLTKIKDLCS
jgi:hypothetical protein